MTSTASHLLGWAIALGAPPEVASALVAHAVAPLPPAADALYRSVVALQLEARDHQGDARGLWAECASRLVLAMCCYSYSLGGGR